MTSLIQWASVVGQVTDPEILHVKLGASQRICPSVQLLQGVCHHPPLSFQPWELHNALVNPSQW